MTVRFGPSQALAGIGAAAAGAALWWSGTPSGALLWTLALTVACVGYGDQLARAFGERPTIGAAAVTGLACLIVGSTGIAHAGWLSRPVELGLVGLGLGLCALGRRGAPERSAATGRRLLVLAALAGVLLLAQQLTSLAPWVTEGVNHSMEVKRLWDTHGLGALPGQAGGLVVGESYLALAGGPGTAGAFDPGLCAALLVLLLAGELASRRDSYAITAFLVLVFPIVLNPEPTLTPVARWSGTLFHVASWFALERAIASRRVTGWVVPSALALIAIRRELAVIALPYLAAGLSIPRGMPSRRGIVLTTAGWLAALTALGSAGPAGVVRALALTAAAAISTALVLPVISTYPWRSALGVLVFVATAANLTTGLGVVAPSAHTGSQPWMLWFTVAVAVFALSDGRLASELGTPRIRIGTAAVTCAGFVALLVLAPNFTELRHARLRDHFVDAVAELRFAAIAGYDTHQAQAAAALQRSIPPGAAIGVWGVSADALDYARNPISDLSWQGGRFLAPLSRGALRGVAYLVVDGVAPAMAANPRSRDPWDLGRAPATLYVDDLLSPVDVAGTARLYRIVHGQPAAQ